MKYIVSYENMLQCQLKMNNSVTTACLSLCALRDLTISSPVEHFCISQSEIHLPAFLRVNEISVKSVGCNLSKQAPCV